MTNMYDIQYKSTIIRLVIIRIGQKSASMSRFSLHDDTRPHLLAV